MKRSVPQRRFAVVAGPALALLLGGGALAEPVRITVLHTNDVYEIAPSKGQGGFAQFMTLLQQERAAARTRSPPSAATCSRPRSCPGLTKGAQMIELYNALGVDVAVLGNHEFDFGPEVAASGSRVARSPGSAPTCSAATASRRSARSICTLIEVGGYRIGFFGLLTPETAMLSSPGPDITFAPAARHRRGRGRAARGEGADRDRGAHPSGPRRRPRSCAPTSTGIDLILGGHDHEPITFYEGGKLIVKAGYDAHYLAAVDLAVDRVEQRDREVVEVVPDVLALPVDRRGGTRPEDPGGRRPLGSRAGRASSPCRSAPRRSSWTRAAARVRTAETNFGDLIADAMRAASAPTSR